MLDPVLDVVQVDHRDALESRRIRAAELGGVCARHLFAVNVAAAASRRPVDCAFGYDRLHKLKCAV